MRIRAVWRPAGLAVLLLVCSNLIHPRPANGADPGPAMSRSQEADSPPHPGPARPNSARLNSTRPNSTRPNSVILHPMSVAWFLNRARRLLHDGRAAEAYQITLAALDLYPGSADVRLGAAFAAMRSGRCQSAIRHLDTLHARRVSAEHRRHIDIVRAGCRGPWRWQVLMGAATGYRPSLVDRQRDVAIRLQPGSRLYGLCTRLVSLCNPDRLLVSHGKPDSGIDLWLNLTIRHLYRAGGDWGLDLETTLFRRRPARPGFAGDGGILRALAAYRYGAWRQVRIEAETGHSRFQQGRADLAISQRHLRGEIGLSLVHAAGLQSDISASHLAVRSQWLDLVRRRYDYRLGKNLHRTLTLSFVGAREISRQKGPGLMPGSRAREVGIALHWRGDHLAAHLHHGHRREAFRGQLPFLAAPHRAGTRTTGLDVMTGDSPRWLNLKVVLSFEYRKISSPDPYRLPSSKTLMLRMSREIFASR